MSSRPIFSDCPQRFNLHISTQAIEALDELNRKAYRRHLFITLIITLVIALICLAAYFTILLWNMI